MPPRPPRAFIRCCAIACSDTEIVLIREYKPSDLDVLRRMHASQGFGYPFPDTADPIFVSKLVLEDDSGRPAMAALARLTCEIYLMIDRDDSAERKPHPTCAGAKARQRYEWLLALHAAGELDLFSRGLEDAHAWLPPPISRRFGRRLEALGWIRDDVWTPYCRRLNP